MLQRQWTMDQRPAWRVHEYCRRVGLMPRLWWSQSRLTTSSPATGPIACPAQGAPMCPGKTHPLRLLGGTMPPGGITRFLACQSGLTDARYLHIRVQQGAPRWSDHDAPPCLTQGLPGQLQHHHQSAVISASAARRFIRLHLLACQACWSGLGLPDRSDSSASRHQRSGDLYQPSWTVQCG